MVAKVATGDWQFACRVSATLEAFDTDDSLGGGGQHLLRRKLLPDVLLQAEPFESGSGENDGVVLARLELREARIYVTA
jgi:hypothetical protein